MISEVSLGPGMYEHVCEYACMHVCALECPCTYVAGVCVFPMLILRFLYDIPYVYLVLLVSQNYTHHHFSSLSQPPFITPNLL